MLAVWLLFFNFKSTKFTRPGIHKTKVLEALMPGQMTLMPSKP